jgi:coproporphyrinogen III oxidase-like Fe-S oxidoreductase
LEIDSRFFFFLFATERSADEWQLVVETLAQHGVQRYEVSNFARSGRHSRHNEAIWSGRMYAGIGPGAHGRLQTVEGKVFELMETKSPHEWSEIQLRVQRDDGKRQST